jgi:hypothetical protein
MIDNNDVYYIKALIENIFDKLQDYKIVQTTKTTVIQLSPTSHPIGHETVVEYSIKRK